MQGSIKKYVAGTAMMMTAESISSKRPVTRITVAYFFSLRCFELVTLTGARMMFSKES